MKGKKENDTTFLSKIEQYAMSNEQHWSCSNEKLVWLFNESEQNERLMDSFLTEGDFSKANKAAHRGLITENFLVMFTRLNLEYQLGDSAKSKHVVALL